LCLRVFPKLPLNRLPFLLRLSPRPIYFN
jgi:hypothetical protein